MTTVHKVGRYEIKAELGRGGMATVLHAHDPHFQRDVALKILPRKFLHDPTFRARFEREAKTVAALEHPAIVPVYDFGEEHGQPYLVMRYLSGGSLTDRLKDGPIPFSETVRIINRIAPGLDEAHKHGIVHRDLKPDNILFDQRNDPFITDFGIVKLSTGASNITTSNLVVGTPAYMSPEQVSNEDLDGRSDIYSLGVIIFQMLTGKLPYQAESPVGLIMKHMTEPVPSILAVKPDLPPGCDPIVMRAMAKEREERYATATDLAAHLASSTSAQTIAMDKVTIFDEAFVQPPRPQQTIAMEVQEKPPPTKKTPPRQRSEKLQSLLDELSVLQKQGVVIHQLAKMGEEAIVALSESLKDPHPYIRYGSAKALSQICQRERIRDETLRAEVVTALTGALSDAESSVRCWAATALSQFKDMLDRQTVEAVAALLCDSEENVRLHAHDALKTIGGEQARKILAGPNTLRLRIGEKRRKFEIALASTIYLGRPDPAGGSPPEVDLSRDHGAEKGVSRRHARIFKREGFVLVEDLGSTNGTFVNGKRIAPYLPEALHHEDRLQLGTLFIDVEMR